MKTLSVRIEDNQDEKLTKYAESNDLSKNQAIRKAIREFLERQVGQA